MRERLLEMLMIFLCIEKSRLLLKDGMVVVANKRGFPDEVVVVIVVLILVEFKVLHLKLLLLSLKDDNDE